MVWQHALALQARVQQLLDAGHSGDTILGTKVSVTGFQGGSPTPGGVRSEPAPFARSEKSMTRSLRRHQRRMLTLARACCAVAVALPGLACSVADPVARLQDALGQPNGDYPSYDERVVLYATNRARSDPAAEG